MKSINHKQLYKNHFYCGVLGNVGLVGMNLVELWSGRTTILALRTAFLNVS